MFEFKLVKAEEFRSFFRENNIPLSGCASFVDVEINRLFINAFKKGQVFAAFILNTVINAEKNGIITNFESFDSIEEAYSQFILGYRSGLDKSKGRDVKSSAAN